MEMEVGGNLVKSSIQRCRDKCVGFGSLSSVPPHSVRFREKERVSEGRLGAEESFAQ